MFILSLISLHMSFVFVTVTLRYLNFPSQPMNRFIITESSKYYARMQTAVARGLGLPAAWLVGHYSDAASKHSLCYFRPFSELTVMRIDVHLQRGYISIYDCDCC